MQSNAKTPEEYIHSLPEERKTAIQKLRTIALEKLPKGFQETINYGTLSYVVPHTLYPNGYHCDPKLPLPFLAFASQKNFISVYHMGIYADKNLFDWFTSEYSKHSTARLDMGKSCIRFKKTEHIPFDLLGELFSKTTPEAWISLYESAFKKREK